MRKPNPAAMAKPQQPRVVQCICCRCPLAGGFEQLLQRATVLQCCLGACRRAGSAPGSPPRKRRPSRCVRRSKSRVPGSRQCQRHLTVPRLPGTWHYVSRVENATAPVICNNFVWRQRVDDFYDPMSGDLQRVDTFREKRAKQQNSTGTFTTDTSRNTLVPCANSRHALRATFVMFVLLLEIDFIHVTRARFFARIQALLPPLEKQASLFVRFWRGGGLARSVWDKAPGRNRSPPA